MIESYQVLLLAQSASREQELRELLLTVLPSASVTPLDVTTAAEGAIPTAAAAVVDVGRMSRPGLDAFRALRARGFAGPSVLVSETPDDETVRRAANALGNARWLSRAEAAEQPVRLAEALAGSDAAKDGRTPASSMAAELARLRRVIAAGELALGLQHDINNPLAGLLAEVQLLQLDELSVDQRAATERMLALCRRVIALVRRLDALGGGKGAV